jgi:hypothetical protein
VALYFFQNYFFAREVSFAGSITVSFIMGFGIVVSAAVATGAGWGVAGGGKVADDKESALLPVPVPLLQAARKR